MLTIFINNIQKKCFDGMGNGKINFGILPEQPTE